MANLIPVSQGFDPESLAPIAAAWAEGSTDMDNPRAIEISVGKAQYVLDFFRLTRRPPQECHSADVQQWIEAMRGRGLAEATVYSRCSRLSAFYRWALKNGGGAFVNNPVASVRPKAPRPYQSDRTKAMTDEQMRGILALARSLADGAKSDRRKLAALRNYTMLLIYFATGLRREEVAQLTWGKIAQTANGIVIETRLKGGKVKQIEIAQIVIRNALMTYAKASGQPPSPAPDAPVWLAHMNNQMTKSDGRAVSSRAVAESFAIYAARLGISNAHLHQTRHTFARIVAEDTGSFVEAQDALGHQNVQTTRVYVDRLGVKRDRFSNKVMARLQ